jgi:beta-lysine 5,6-aminomutase alpha subunit
MELRIDSGIVADARRLSREIAAPVSTFIAAHSTVAVERSVLRLLGVDGVCADDAPVPNRVLERLGPGRLSGGAARPIGALVAETGRTPDDVASALAEGTLDASLADGVPEAAART